MEIDGLWWATWYIQAEGTVKEVSESLAVETAAEYGLSDDGARFGLVEA
jgi:hypothetical protein